MFVCQRLIACVSLLISCCLLKYSELIPGKYTRTCYQLFKWTPSQTCPTWNICKYTRTCYQLFKWTPQTCPTWNICKYTRTCYQLFKWTPSQTCPSWNICKYTRTCYQLLSGHLFKHAQLGTSVSKPELATNYSSGHLKHAQFGTSVSTPELATNYSSGHLL